MTAVEYLISDSVLLGESSLDVTGGVFVNEYINIKNTYHGTWYQVCKLHIMIQVVIYEHISR